MDEHNYRRQQELDRGERVVVGINRFVPEKAAPPPRFRFDPARMTDHLRRFGERKAQRDAAALTSKIDALYRVAQRGDNAHPAMIEALMADASVGEVWGTVRVASGLPYDPFRIVRIAVHLSDSMTAPVPGKRIRCLLAIARDRRAQQGHPHAGAGAARQGVEVIYLGEHNTADGVVRAAIAEDADVIGHQLQHWPPTCTTHAS